MKILHVARAPLTGVWSMMKHLAAAQRASGHDVGMLLFVGRNWPHYRELQELGIPATLEATPELSATVAFAYHEANHSSRKVRQCGESADVLHFHNAWMTGALQPGCARETVTFHGVPGDGFLRGKPVRLAMHRHWAKRVSESSAKLVSVDRAGPEKAEQSLHIRGSRFSVIPNGAPDPGRRGCPSLRHEQIVTAGYVGLLHPGKGWIQIAEGLRLAAAAGLRVRLLIAGPGSAEAAALANDYCARIGNGSEYLGLVPDASSKVMPGLDCLLIASEIEGMPMCVLEALACGVPVITTKVPGICEAVRDGVEGRYIQRDPECIKSCLEDVVARPGVLAELSQAARARFEQNYRIETMAEAYGRVYGLQN